MINVINKLASFFKINEDGTKICLNTSKFIESVNENIDILRCSLFSGSAFSFTPYVCGDILNSEPTFFELPYSASDLECYNNVINYFMKNGPSTKEEILSNFNNKGNFRFLKYPIFLDKKGLVNLDSNEIILDRKKLDKLLHKEYKIEKIKIINLNKDNLEKLLVNTYRGSYISNDFSSANRKIIIDSPLSFSEGYKTRFKLYLALKNNFIEKNKKDIYVRIKNKKIYLSEKNITSEYINKNDTSSYESVLRYLLCVQFGVNPSEEFSTYNSYFSDYIGFSNGESIFFN